MNKGPYSSMLQRRNRRTLVYGTACGAKLKGLGNEGLMNLIAG